MIEGEVFTALLGADASWNQWLTGVVLAYSDGEGAFTHETAKGGSTVSTLMTLNPYAQYRFNDRTNVWGTLGVGAGDLSLTPMGATVAVKTDLDMTMAAFGGRGILSVHGNESAQFELALRSDTMYSQVKASASTNLRSAKGTANRLRVMLEGTGSWAITSKGMLKSTLEAGLRYDGGDAETGTGIEIGGGLALRVGAIEFATDARGIVAHEAQLYDEWGFSSSVEYRPHQDGRGLNLNLGSSWGAMQSQEYALSDRETARGLTGVCVAEIPRQSWIRRARSKRHA